jgi:hypothetical protein
MNIYKAFNVHERGFSHISSGIPRQDNSYSHYDDEYSIAIIADGHGSPQYLRSDIGSELAVNVCADLLSDLIKGKKDAKKNEDKIKRFIKRNWDAAVFEHYSNNLFTAEELSALESKIAVEDDPRQKSKMSQYLEYFKEGKLVQKAYGSTLIAVASCDEYTLGVHIGDGTCVAFYPDGSCDQPIPADKNNMANNTGSLCNDDTGCRVYFFDKKPIALFVASDGLDDSFGQGEALYIFYRELCLNIASKGEDYFKELKEDLSVISQKGSKDDMSIAGLYNEERLKLLSPIIQKRLACGKLKYQLYSLQETNGGISEYSLKAKEAKLKKAQEEHERYEQEKLSLMGRQNVIKQVLLRLKAIFNYDDPDAVGKKLLEFEKQTNKHKKTLESLEKELYSLRQKIAKRESEIQDISNKLERVDSERKHFLSDYEQYQSSHVDEQTVSDQQRIAEEKCAASAENEKKREEDYRIACASFHNAQDRKKGLIEQIDQIENEIVQAINELMTKKQNLDESTISDDTDSTDTHDPLPLTPDQQAQSEKQRTDDEINDALALLENR